MDFNEEDYKFDNEEYDRKVAESITNMRKKVKNKFLHQKYNEWLYDNEMHLLQMYEISNLKCGYDAFCHFIYSTI